IRQLLTAPLEVSPNQEIVYRDLVRLTYREMRERIARLSCVLAALGVGPGTTVAVLDWDSHRYLECFYAIPMMGAVLMTANVRLSVDQIAYTLNHSHAEVLIAHRDFASQVEHVLNNTDAVRHVVWITDGAAGKGGEISGLAAGE